MECIVDIVERRGFVIGLWLHTAVEPPQSEWDAGVERFVALKKEKPGVLQRLKQIVISDGASPSMRQRGQLFSGVLEGAPVASVALTTVLTNPVKRGVAKAITWINPGFKAVGPEQWAEALAHLDLVGESDIFNEFSRLEPKLSSPNQALMMIKKSIAARTIR